MSFRRLKYVSPLHYEVELTPNLEHAHFEGIVKIDFVLNKENVTQLVLYSSNLVIETNSVHIYSLSSPSTIQWKPTVTLNEKHETVEFSLDHHQTFLLNETYRIEIKFNGQLQTSQLQGFYRTEHPKMEDNNGNVRMKRNYYAITQMSPTHCRRVFPCLDEPSFRTTFDIILHVPQHLLALSNMPILSEKLVENNIKRVQFQRTPVMPTFLLCFIVGQFDVLKADPIELTEFITTTSSNATQDVKETRKIDLCAYTLPGKADDALFALKCARRALYYFSNLFELNYPLPKLDLITVPGLYYPAMENWGLVTFKEEELLLCEKRSNDIQYRNVCQSVTHEIAHQWFGNLVSINWWNDVYVIEGFAKWFEYLATDHCLPEVNVFSEFFYTQYIRYFEYRLNTLHIEPEDIDEKTFSFEGFIYSKGSCLMRMIHLFIGDKAFLTATRYYLKKFQYSTATANDFWLCIEEITHLPIRKIIQTWCTKQSYPVVSVNMISYDESTGSCDIELKQVSYCQGHHQKQITCVCEQTTSTDILKDTICSCHIRKNVNYSCRRLNRSKSDSSISVLSDQLIVSDGTNVSSSSSSSSSNIHPNSTAMKCASISNGLPRRKTVSNDQHFLNFEHNLDGDLSHNNSNCWVIPITILCYDENSNPSTVEKFLMDKQRLVIHLKTAHFKVNATCSGTYRVLYQDNVLNNNLREAIKTNKINEYDRFNVENDLHSLVMGGFSSLVDYLRLLFCYIHENDEETVWKDIESNIIRIATMLEYDQSLIEYYRKYIVDVHKTLYYKLGWTAVSGESTSRARLRSFVLIILGNIGYDEEVISEARRRFQSYVNDSNEPIWWPICAIIAHHASQSDFISLIKMYIQRDKQDDRLRCLFGLSYVQNPHFIQRTLDLISFAQIRLHERIEAYKGFCLSKVGRDYYCRYIEENWQSFRSNYNDEYLEAIIRETFGYFSTTSEANRIEDFFQQYEQFHEKYNISTIATTTTTTTNNHNRNINMLTLSPSSTTTDLSDYPDDLTSYTTTTPPQLMVPPKLKEVASIIAHTARSRASVLKRDHYHLLKFFQNEYPKLRAQYCTINIEPFLETPPEVDLAHETNGAEIYTLLNETSNDRKRKISTTESTTTMPSARKFIRLSTTNE
ncbi:unnamed protein product [Didymodactylos carnosus]|uniref:Aminopeptidase n=1 Tax=Didymodactylos carnosus TaxID=1234261 RepID=A0A814AJI8_9BILA|nr:unnamed protein product [Didymodactylos carnosus]CAF3695423.1 unnamed protein product [Didymodactylos carnosus]